MQVLLAHLGLLACQAAVVSCCHVQHLNVLKIARTLYCDLYCFRHSACLLHRTRRRYHFRLIYSVEAWLQVLNR